MAVGVLSKHIARAENQKQEIVEATFTAGLLHETGRLVLASNLPEEYSEMLDMARRGNLSVIEAERKTFGSAYPEVGAYLLGLWGCPTRSSRPWLSIIAPRNPARQRSIR